jgi:hypothetical protein
MKQCLTSKGNLQAIRSSIKENDFHGAFEAWKNDGIAVYVPKETILKEIAAKIKLNQHFFFDLVRELSNRTSYDAEVVILLSKVRNIGWLKSYGQAVWAS